MNDPQDVGSSPIGSCLPVRCVGRYAGMPSSGKPVKVVTPSCPIETSTIGSPKSFCWYRAVNSCRR